MSIINYQGKISFSRNSKSVSFDKVNLLLSADEVSNSYENIFGSKISIRKGYELSSSFTIYLLNKISGSLNADYENMKILLSILNELKRTQPITISLYNENSSVIKTFEMDILESEIPFSDYLKGNSLLGLEFKFDLKKSRLVQGEELNGVWTNV